MSDHDRYHVSPIRNGECTFYNLYDEVESRVLGTAFWRSDAERMAAGLNLPRASKNPRLRPLAAMEIADFRMHLEHDNGGPLHDAGIALLLSDLCDFLKFNTGERAIALGRDLLVLLATLGEVE